MTEEEIPLEGIMQELGRRCQPFGLTKAEALNWILTIPGLDDFFSEVKHIKGKILQ